MKTLPQISEAEFEVMKIIWKHAPISTNEITGRLTQTTKWSPKTIQTLIKRLVTKGALSYVKQSRVFVYTPLIKEKEYIRQESRYYHGDITAMLSAYIEDDKLSESKIDALRSLLLKGTNKLKNATPTADATPGPARIRSFLSNSSPLLACVVETLTLSVEDSPG